MQATLAALERALPPNEWAAVSAWVTTFLPFQREWLLDWSRFALLNKARQIGASHTIGGGCSVLWGLLGETTTIVSVGEREANEVLDKAKRHAEVLAKLGSKWAEPRFRNGELRLASGGRVMALPSTSGARGYTSNAILDEFAYHQHPKKVWDAAAGAVMHSGLKLRVMSTPNGVGNMWHELWSDPKQNKGYRKHSVTLEQAMADGLTVDVEECWAMARGDPRVFDQLFRGSFIDGELQYIPSDAVNAAAEDDVPPTFGYAFAGLDIGRSNDRTVMKIIRADVSGVFHVIYSAECKRTSQPDIDRMVDAAFDTWDIRRLCVDATGLGIFPAEEIQRRHGRNRVEPVSFTLTVKEDLATGLYSSIVGQQLKFPKSDTQLRDDLCSLRRIITDAGNVRYDAPTTDKGHADSAWALALAVHAAGKQPRGVAAHHGMV